MKSLKTKGIIISENNVGDFDKMLTILTPGYGKIGCFVKGARRIKSPLLACSQFLCFGDYLLYKTADNYIMTSGETIELFYNIRIDLDKLKYAVNINKIIQEVTTENQNSYRILTLFLNTLYLISETNKDLSFVLAVFKIKLMSLIGFMPNVKECIHCKTKDDLLFFSIKDSGLKCKECVKRDIGAIEIKEATRIALQYIIFSESKRIYNFEITNEIKKELEIISKVYLNEKLDKEFI